MPAVIEVQDLVKQYKKATGPAVAGVSFEVGQGQKGPQASNVRPV